MIKFSKITLFFLIVLMSGMGGITFSMIDWDIIETGKGIDIYREINMPIVFLLLAFSFVIPYVKKLKEENNSEDKNR